MKLKTIFINLLIFLLYIIFMLYYTQRTESYINDFYNYISLLFKNYLWEYNDKAMEDISNIIFKNVEYREIAVYDESGNLFFKMENPKKLNKIDLFFEKMNFIHEVSLSKSLDNNGIYIGEMYVKMVNRSFYVKLLGFLIYVLLAFLYNQMVVINETKRKLEKSNRELEDTLEELENTIENLNRTQELLINSEKMASLGRLVANISHDLNTPLGIAYTSVTQLMKDFKKLEEGYISGQVSKKLFEDYLNSGNELLDIILANLMRMSDLIKSLKKVSAQEVSNIKLKVNLKEELEAILKSLNPVIRKTSHKISLKCPDDIEMVTYPGAIAQIITNFIDNSLKHGFKNYKENGRINIEVFNEKDSVKIIYSDNGRGMDEKTKSAIFEPFFTTDNSGESSGIGMNVVYNLVNTVLQGQIYVESAPGKGVKFTVILPKVVSESK
ncbi:signal transduction histidine kinase [Marinitoga piezophila KA3]|uniref:histidine kinase n=1 Tax=Marinitoga piezophila (strain DSM 14283 / JCM 11233 / KA3) TaxID=443254 RepID=H2J6N5_MARPK|nr:HAMP domain-containing sensor histidine kinase [Marinitoga piezophila]AEX86316.1 signal transduction histidine kinase [Marinitoga piezophila KA3]